MRTEEISLLIKGVGEGKGEMLFNFLEVRVLERVVGVEAKVVGGTVALEVDAEEVGGERGHDC